MKAKILVITAASFALSGAVALFNDGLPEGIETVRSTATAVWEKLSDRLEQALDDTQVAFLAWAGVENHSGPGHLTPVTGLETSDEAGQLTQVTAPHYRWVQSAEALQQTNVHRWRSEVDRPLSQTLAPWRSVAWTPQRPDDGSDGLDSWPIGGRTFSLYRNAIGKAELIQRQIAESRLIQSTSAQKDATDWIIVIE